MENSTLKTSIFSGQLLSWHYSTNNRSMPWKGEKNPYKIWLSEIILQQTRVEQGMQYYHNFINAYPTVMDLADAPDDEVFKKWEGLGYYSRCRNLLATARIIAHEYQGHFPENYDQLLQLKGVGPYTAAAIASFAFGLPHAVVDGNVIRVLSRYFGIQAAFDTTEGKKIFQELAKQALAANAPADYNQAIMDFGATVCKPVNPLCNKCALALKCFALKNAAIAQLPVKEKRLVKKYRYFIFIKIIANQQTWVVKRSDKDVWHQLYAFFTHELPDEKAFISFDIKNFFSLKLWSPNDVSAPSVVYRQTLTHQHIRACFYELTFTHPPLNLPESGIWVSKEALQQLAFPQIINQYLQLKQMKLL